MTSAAGMPAYEISNHARRGAESRHNLTYWRYGDYAGVGPGAHGRRLGLRSVRHRKPENFLSAIRRNGHGIARKRRSRRSKRRTRRWSWGCVCPTGSTPALSRERFGFENHRRLGKVERLVGSGHLSARHSNRVGRPGVSCSTTSWARSSRVEPKFFGGSAAGRCGGGSGVGAVASPASRRAWARLLAMNL